MRPVQRPRLVNERKESKTNIISRDLREWCDDADVDGDSSGELRAIADRIDREMAEKERLKKENAELTG